MQPYNVVLLQSDPGTTQFLAAHLRSFFRSVREARSFDDVRNNVAKHRAEVAVIDLEMASIQDVAHLLHEFPRTCIVCNHRLADEEMWAATLNAGAVECCLSQDTGCILSAALRFAPAAHALAA